MAYVTYFTIKYVFHQRHLIAKKIADIYSLDFLLVERIIFSSISQDSMGTSINLLNSPASPLNSPPSKVTVWKNKVKPKSSKIRTIHTSALTQLA